MWQGWQALSMLFGLMVNPRIVASLHCYWHYFWLKKKGKTNLSLERLPLCEGITYTLSMAIEDETTPPEWLPK